MAYDETLGSRVREVLAGRDKVTERAMFGGLAFMLGGHMCCGVVKEDLMIRLAPEQAEAALESGDVRPMDFTGRPMKGFLFVAPANVETEDGLRRWVDAAADFAASRPPK